jgi:hypothetical protein
LATIAMLKGRDGVAWLRSLGVSHLFVDEDGTMGGTEAGTSELTPSC